MTATAAAIDRRDDVRAQARKDLERSGVLLLNGHFDYGNGFHGRVYLNPHQVFRYPSTVWRLAQDLLAIVPSDILDRTDVVAGPTTGGALLAHTIAGLLDGRRALSHPPCSFAPLVADPSDADRTDDHRHQDNAADDRGPRLRSFYAGVVRGRRVLLADDVRNTGKTLERCAAAIRAAGGEVIATVQIYDRLEAVVDLGVPNFALLEYPAPENFAAADCPLCRAGEPFTTF